ncbi:hypothetical protein E2542_SST16626 [Spatholobus suberectus]|nr:hypothetical protein E2542_SST16626 [Spatholobus suberectus]
MARPARRLLPLLAGIVVFILSLGKLNFMIKEIGTESRYEKAMGEAALMDTSSANWDTYSKRGENSKVYCCYDNHIGRCNPGTADDNYCDSICRKHPCDKGVSKAKEKEKIINLSKL